MLADEGRGPEVPLYEPRELPKRPARHTTPVWGNARLGSKDDLVVRPLWSVGPERLRLHATPLVEASGDGAVLAALPYQGIDLSGEDLNRHLLCIAQTGDGKTLRFIAQVVLTLLANTQRTLVVVNSKGPWFTRVIVALARRFRPGSGVVTINMVDPRRSCAWNPVATVREETDAFVVATALCNAVEEPAARVDSPFWRQSSIELLTGMLLSGEVKSLVDAWRRSRLSVGAFGGFATRHSEIRQLGRMADYIRTGSHNAETIMQDLAIRLAAIGVLDTRIRAVTCGRNEFVAREFVNRGGDILVLEIPEEDAPRLRPLTNLFVTDLFDAIIAGADCRPDGCLKTPLAFVCDEFATSVGRILDFETKVNTLRSRGAALICATQSLNQLELVYGPAAKPLLDGFSSLVTIGSLSEADRAYVSQKAGTITARQWTVTEELDPHTGTFEPKNRTDSIIGRPLLLMSDLVHDPHPVFGPLSVVFLPQRPPILAHLTPAWEIPVLERAMEDASSDRRLNQERAEPLRGPEEAGAAFAPISLITDTYGWTDEAIQGRLAVVNKDIGLETATGPALRWWRTLVAQNGGRLAGVLRFAEELLSRKASITEFHRVCARSRVHGMQGNLHYFDYVRLRKDERKRRDAAQELSD